MFEPEVKLVRWFQDAKELTLGAARTCYSGSGIITPENAFMFGKKKTESKEAGEAIFSGIYDGGHHTTFQHPHFSFTLDNVSRHFLWSFLHSHPFYNSEQVSQRYVEVRRGNYVVPPMNEKQHGLYEKIMDVQMAAYHDLIEQLVPIVAEQYYRLFPARKTLAKWDPVVKKKTQELARYVLPIATTSYLYHTVSGLTLMRYYRMCEQPDVPFETKIVITKMIEEARNAEPEYFSKLERPISLDDTLEYKSFEKFGKGNAKAFIEDFDRRIKDLSSKLVDWKENAEQTMAQSVRDVLGFTVKQLSDDDAIELILNPARNKYLGEKMNISTHSKLERTMFHVHYTFLRKLSHTADSQDQRHRMTPASRPIIAGQLTSEPDCVWPEMFYCIPEILDKAEKIAEESWRTMTQLRDDGLSTEFAQYVLPNSLAIRFTESGDLLNLMHKWHMRLCLNAQEEIWRASVEEVKQIAEVHPKIVEFAGPPCLMRHLASINPKCPEGERYCGVPLWKKRVDEYERTI